ncbi:MAG: hypothetical protein WDW20_00580 [Neisseriaceae bacterium]
MPILGPSSALLSIPASLSAQLSAGLLSSLLASPGPGHSVLSSLSAIPLISGLSNASSAIPSSSLALLSSIPTSLSFSSGFSLNTLGALSAIAATISAIFSIPASSQLLSTSSSFLSTSSLLPLFSSSLPVTIPASLEVSLAPSTTGSSLLGSSSVQVAKSSLYPSVSSALSQLNPLGSSLASSTLPSSLSAIPLSSSAVPSLSGLLPAYLSSLSVTASSGPALAIDSGLLIFLPSVLTASIEIASIFSTVSGVVNFFTLPFAVWENVVYSVFSWIFGANSYFGPWIAVFAGFGWLDAQSFLANLPWAFPQNLLSLNFVLSPESVSSTPLVSSSVSSQLPFFTSSSLLFPQSSLLNIPSLPSELTSADFGLSFSASSLPNLLGIGLYTTLFVVLQWALGVAVDVANWFAAFVVLAGGATILGLASSISSVVSTTGSTELSSSWISLLNSSTFLSILDIPTSLSGGPSIDGIPASSSFSSAMPSISESLGSSAPSLFSIVSGSTLLQAGVTFLLGGEIYWAFFHWFVITLITDAAFGVVGEVLALFIIGPALTLTGLLPSISALSSLTTMLSLNNILSSIPSVSSLPSSVASAVPLLSSLPSWVLPAASSYPALLSISSFGLPLNSAFDVFAISVNSISSFIPPVASVDALLSYNLLSSVIPSTISVFNPIVHLLGIASWSNHISLSGALSLPLAISLFSSGSSLLVPSLSSNLSTNSSSSLTSLSSTIEAISSSLSFSSIPSALPSMISSLPGTISFTSSSVLDQLGFNSLSSQSSSWSGISALPIISLNPTGLSFGLSTLPSNLSSALFSSLTGVSTSSAAVSGAVAIPVMSSATVFQLAKLWSNQFLSYPTSFSLNSNMVVSYISSSSNPIASSSSLPSVTIWTALPVSSMVNVAAALSFYGPFVTTAIPFILYDSSTISTNPLTPSGSASSSYSTLFSNPSIPSLSSINATVLEIASSYLGGLPSLISTPVNPSSSSSAPAASSTYSSLPSIAVALNSPIPGGVLTSQLSSVLPSSLNPSLSWNLSLLPAEVFSLDTGSSISSTSAFLPSSYSLLAGPGYFLSSTAAVLLSTVDAALAGVIIAVVQLLHSVITLPFTNTSLFFEISNTSSSFITPIHFTVSALFFPQTVFSLILAPAIISSIFTPGSGPLIASSLLSVNSAPTSIISFSTSAFSLPLEVSAVLPFVLSSTASTLPLQLSASIPASSTNWLIIPVANYLAVSDSYIVSH